MSAPVSGRAEAAREGARQGDGKFGAQALDGVGLSLAAVARPDLEAGVAQGLLRRREDGRFDVADHGEADALFGCPEDDWCSLARGHRSPCAERDVWAGTDELYDPAEVPGITVPDGVDLDYPQALLLNSLRKAGVRGTIAQAVRGPAGEGRLVLRTENGGRLEASARIHSTGGPSQKYESGLAYWPRGAKLDAESAGRAAGRPGEFDVELDERHVRQAVTEGNAKQGIREGFPHAGQNLVVEIGSFEGRDGNSSLTVRHREQLGSAIRLNVDELGAVRSVQSASVVDDRDPERVLRDILGEPRTDPMELRKRLIDAWDNAYRRLNG